MSFITILFVYAVVLEAAYFIWLIWGSAWLLKIALSPSSHTVLSGIWASGILVMHFIFHEYLTRILQGS